MTTATFPSTLDWLDTSEARAADAIRASLEDDDVLASWSGLWRSGWTAASAIPAALRPAPLGVDAFSRGGRPAGGGLGEDYPTGLCDATRAAWTLAASSLAAGAAMTPAGWAEAGAAHALATRIAQAPEPALAPTPRRVLHEDGVLRISRVLPHAEAAGAPVVVVASMINRAYVLDVLRGRSFLAMLASLGRPVYLIDWRAPDGEPDERSLGEIVDAVLRPAVERVCAAHDAGAAAVVGYCMGGTMAAALAARRSDLVERLATVCSPVRFGDGGLFARWLSSDHVDVDLVADAHEQIPGWLVHLPFWWLRPTVKTRKLVGLVRSSPTPEAIERFLAAEIWNQDHVDMTRGVFRSWIGELYQRDALVHGEFVVGGRPVDLAAIACPLLVVTGTSDAIAPPASADALASLAGSPSKRCLRIETGHVGVVTSPRALAPQADAFAQWLGADPESARTGEESPS